MAIGILRARIAIILIAEIRKIRFSIAEIIVNARMGEEVEE